MVPQGKARRGGHHISSEIAQARIATAGPPAICRLRPLASLQARTRKTMFASMLENRKTGMPTRPLSTIATDTARVKHEASRFLETASRALGNQIEIPRDTCTHRPRPTCPLSAHALEGEPLGGLQRMEVAVAANLLARLDQAAHPPRPAAARGAPHAVHVVGSHGRPACGNVAEWQVTGWQEGPRQGR